MLCKSFFKHLTKAIMPSHNFYVHFSYLNLKYSPKYTLLIVSLAITILLLEKKTKFETASKTLVKSQDNMLYVKHRHIFPPQIERHGKY